ncbi:MAG: ABC transporter permease [Candidatus Pelagibacter sp.]|mgnify:CR=1 FL=1|nr:ABC transporter permease [Candidatus Pelagibacter sp.]OUV87726.1 MAG: ABC transporter permease [Pelagibacteraceae bacterium TMED136]
MNKSDLIKRIYRTQIKKYIPDLIIVVAFMILHGASTAAVAWLLDPAIKKIFIEQDKLMLYLIPVAIVITFLIKSLSLYFTRIQSINISFKVKESIQKSLAEKILHSDLSYIHDNHSGKFISNFTEDTHKLQNVTQTVALNSTKEIISLFFLIALMISKDIYLSILALILIPLAALIARKLGKRMGKAVYGALEANESFTKYLSEILKSVTLIKIFQREKDEMSKLGKIIKNWIDKSTKVEKTRLGSAPMMETLTGFAVASVVFAGGFRSMNGNLEIGAFFSFLTALMLAYQPVRQLAGINIALNEGFTAATRIYKILDEQVLIKNSKHAKLLDIKDGNIEFHNVSMNYRNGPDILHNINLKIQGKAKVALVGSSGGGKSTILNLIPRFYDPKEGYISIDDQKISEVTLETLRKEIALVSQDIVLFDDTIKNNLIFGNFKATDKEIENACIKANCHNFITEMKEGYDTIVGENGVKLSGGQKQRISIARAILKNSSIILLDEATSALDTESEKIVQEAMNNLSENKTTVTIAHRLSTIKNSDLIYVIDKGIVIEKGTHEQLININKIYKKLCDQQTLN